MSNITIQLNGESFDFDSSSLQDLLKNQNIDLSFTAIAINNCVVPSADVHKTHLKNGDCVEVVHAVSGG